MGLRWREWQGSYANFAKYVLKFRSNGNGNSESRFDVLGDMEEGGVIKEALEALKENFSNPPFQFQQ